MNEIQWPQPIYVFTEPDGVRLALNRVTRKWKRVDVMPVADVVVLDDDLLAELDKRAKRQHTDRAGYLRWVLTSKSPAAATEEERTS